MKYILLLDGGFINHKYVQAYNREPRALDIKNFSDSLIHYNDTSDTLVRIYYYDSQPLATQIRKPVSGSMLDLSKTAVYTDNKKKLFDLKRTNNFAVREGRLVFKGWKLKPTAFGKSSSTLSDSDYSLDIQQKGVDMKIGLDIAWISFNRIADRILVVTGDSDFIPAIKLARRNGIQVYLFTLDHGVSEELTEHSDRLITTAIDSL